ncbi:MAG: LuxR C-terminal-related transcriptional regulator [Bacteroidota bacterium]
MHTFRSKPLPPLVYAKKSPYRNLLSRREQEILQLICEELTTAEIAQRLYISRRTVDGHRANLLTKLGCKNIAGLVMKAVRYQLVELDLQY